jgi:MtrB/PioB family decaheme-associated outer membrane protein
MSTISRRPGLVLIAAALLLLAGLAPLAAQEAAEQGAGQTPAEDQATAETTAEDTAEDSAEDSGGFTFRVDPIALEVLETDVDTESSKFEEYRDLDSGFRPSLHLFGEGGDRTLDVRADAIGRDDARYSLAYGVSGRYGFLFDFNKIPHRFGNDGHMLFTRTGDGRYEIADPVQAAIESAVARQFAINRNGVNFAFLDNLLAPYLATATEVDLGLIRDRALVRLDLGRMARLGWTLEYSHENRKGTRPFGATFGFNNVTELPEPIDYQTDQAELAGEWNTENAGLRFGYRYSTFKNDISTVIWDNPFRINPTTDANAYQSPSSSSINGSSIGFADLAPDNEASLVFLTGRARFAGDWFANGSVSYNVMTQDDPLLPYTLNPSIVGIDHETGARFDPTNVANLPTRNADNEVDVFNVNAQAGTRFGESFGLTFRYRLYDYDNQSRRIEFPGYVRFHGVWEEIARITVPYAYTVQDLGAELGWDLARDSRLALSYTLQTWDREFREVESSDEDILKLSFDSRPLDWVTLRASYELGDRSIDGYDPAAQEHSFVEPEGVNNIPALRKFAQAAREYHQYNVQAQFFAAQAWNFFFGVTGRDEDYDESAFGLIADEIVQYNFEIGYTPGDNLNFYLFGHRADRDVFQRARQSGATPSTNPLDDWTADFDEKTDTWGLGFNSRFAEKWTTDVSANWTKSDGFADFTAFPGGAPLGTRPQALDFENYEDIELLALLGRLDYRITDQATAGLFYRYEDYTIDSFILQGLANYLPGALLLNPEQGDYEANVFGISLNVAF